MDLSDSCYSTRRGQGQVTRGICGGNARIALRALPCGFIRFRRRVVSSRITPCWPVWRRTLGFKTRFALLWAHLPRMLTLFLVGHQTVACSKTLPYPLNLMDLICLRRYTFFNNRVQVHGTLV
eukprot:364611-Chlamydomonas_euryale.AAC.4